MENNFNNGKSGYNDESFIPDKKPQKNSRKSLAILLLIVGLLFFAMISSIFYDWGVNRGGFSDIADLFSSKEKVADEPKKNIQKEEVFVDKDLPEYDIYMDTVGSQTDDDEIVYEEESEVSSKPEEKPTQIASHPEQKKSKDVIIKPEKQTQDAQTHWENLPYPDNITTRIKKSNVKEADQLFTVQVYASPSLDDAEEWKDKLSRQNLSDVVITSQTVKDRSWYRVRFGTFKSYEEAKAAAQKSGFAHAWIDRLK